MPSQNLFVLLFDAKVCIIRLSTQIEGRSMSQVKSISLQNLLIDLQNPRYDPRTNQREAIITIVNEQGSKLVALADDIVNESGLNPSELPMVMPSGDENTFIVMEGNRRLTALKLLLSPSLVAGTPGNFTVVTDSGITKWGVGLIQNIDKAATTLYVSYHDYSPEAKGCTGAATPTCLVTNQSLEHIRSIQAGAIVRF